MRLPRVRFTIGRLMLVVAVIALLLTWLDARVALALVGLILLGVDVGAGMPWWWSAFEGPLWAGLGALMLVLARPDRRPRERGETPRHPPAAAYSARPKT